MAFHQALPWHEGEEKMHALTKVPVHDNPNNPGLSPRAAHQIQIFPMMAIGTTDPDDDHRPWTTLWGGEAPISQPIAPGGIIGIKTTVDASFDPVVKALLGTSTTGEIIKSSQGQGAMVSAVSINLETRNRVKLFGHMVGGALDGHELDGDNQSAGQSDNTGIAGSAQLVLKIEQSLANCPKYLNKKIITNHANPKPRLLSTEVILPSAAVELVQNADMFFISSSNKFEDMDTNHRGGSPGFIRVQQPDAASEVQATSLVWPEYSGNNLYQTLGNLMTTPRAGIAIPNYLTGDILYLTGDTEVLLNQDANSVLPKSKLAVKFTVHRARYVQDGLGFRGTPVEDGPSQGRSPYNPRVRLLRNEKSTQFTKDYSKSTTPASTDLTAKLIKKTKLSPTITKYRFSLSDPSVHGPWKPGQYVALDFSDELDMGYSHMRDDDPTSLNDDYIRTFTVSSSPGSLGIHDEEFEIIVRSVGNVTRWLSWQREGMVEAKVLGFGGDFSFQNGNQDDEKIKTGQKVFVAQGIGITPLLGQLGTVDDLKVRWTINVKDVGVVLDVVKACSNEIKKNMIVYLTGSKEDITEELENSVTELRTENINIERRRMVQDDLTKLQPDTDDWYMCAAPAVRKVIQGWLPEKSIIFENFDY